MIITSSFSENYVIVEGEEDSNSVSASENLDGEENEQQEVGKVDNSSEAEKVSDPEGPMAKRSKLD
jgi:hypothetical protein